MDDDVDERVFPLRSTDHAVPLDNPEAKNVISFEMEK
jgi:hypothetical protein